MTISTRDLQRLKQDLQENPLIIEVDFHWEPPISEAGLDIFREVFSIDPAPELQGLYRIANGMRLFWRYREGTEVAIGGEAGISGLLDCFAGDEAGLLGFETVPEDDPYATEFLGLMLKMKVLDRLEESYQNTRFVTLEMAEQRVRRMWFWDTEGDKYPLSCTPEEYLGHLIRARAMLDWQYFYIDLEGLDLNHTFYSQWLYGATLQGTLDSMEGYCSRYAEVFSSAEAEVYRERLKAVRRTFSI
jgi:hypothetical protein